VKETVYRFGAFELSDRERVLRRNGRLVGLPPKALSALQTLARADGRVVSKKEMLAAVWPDTFVEEGTLSQTISILRRQLTLDKDQESPIETISRVGYRLRIPVEVSARLIDLAAAPGVEAEAAAAPHTETVKLPAAEEHFRTEPGVGIERRERGFFDGTRLKTLVAVVACLLAAVMVWFYVKDFHLRAINRKEHPRVAVLAFRNLSQQADKAWLSKALQELLSTDLANTKLQIIPVETVEHAEKTVSLTRTDDLSPDSLRQIANDLNCDELVMGSYLVAGNQIRLDSHLVDAKSGVRLANFSSTGLANELLALIEDTSAEMRNDFRLPGEQDSDLATLASSVPHNPQAYQLYFEGIEKLRAFDAALAAHYLEESIALEPEYPLSHIELSHAVTLLGQADRALEEAHKGRALAGHLSRIDQLRVEAICEAVEHRFDAAAATYGTLFALVPQDLEYARSQASLLENAGHNQQAIHILEPLVNGSSKERDFSAIELVIGQGYDNLDNYPQARMWAKRTEDDAKRRGDLALYGRALTAEAAALRAMNEFEQALPKTNEAVDLARKLGDQAGALQGLLETAQINAGMGHTPEAQAILQRALALGEASGQIQKQIYVLNALGHNYTKMGDLKEALVSFQRSLTLARTFKQPGLIQRAEFNVAETEGELGHTVAARDGFDHLLDKAISSGDQAAALRAKQALNKLTSPKV
jgi:DNA-binding winged helix-turn-helix (wHTH) protein/tetratricopeptide (TPR) repeat protein